MMILFWLMMLLLHDWLGCRNQLCLETNSAVCLSIFSTFNIQKHIQLVFTESVSIWVACTVLEDVSI